MDHFYKCSIELWPLVNLYVQWRVCYLIFSISLVFELCVQSRSSKFICIKYNLIIGEEEEEEEEEEEGK